MGVVNRRDNLAVDPALPLDFQQLLGADEIGVPGRSRESDGVQTVVGLLGVDAFPQSGRRGRIVFGYEDQAAAFVRILPARMNFQRWTQLCEISLRKMIRVGCIVRGHFGFKSGFDSQNKSILLATAAAGAPMSVRGFQMAVLAVITDESKAAAMTRWACQFAHAENQPLSILFAVKDHGAQEPRFVAATKDEGVADDPVLQAIRKTLEEAHCCSREMEDTEGDDGSVAAAPPETEEPAPESAVIRKLIGAERRSSIMSAIAAEKPSLLIVGKHISGRSEDANALLARHLFENAPCDTLLLRPGDTDGSDCDRVLTPLGGGPHSRRALQLARKVVENNDGVVTPLYVEPDTDEVASEVGERVLAGLLKKAGVEVCSRVQPKVVLANNVNDGIRDEASKEYDLLLIGDSDIGRLRKRLFGAVPDRLLTGNNGMAVAVVRRAKPMGERLRRKLEQWLHFRVPQLKREDRINLFENLQINSRWSFDFMALICLATAIAALGLIVNSTAVVIGAMLVAPLMTPLLGAGLSLVQGNLPLMKTCARAIVFGFFAALGIGVVMGFVTPIRELTPEMAARGGPTLLDMAVAFLAGVAASYCVARPRLTAALAGVAIAAALVPPIATTGISIALGEVTVARGAAALFASNVVAIILGAAINFYAAGIRGGGSSTDGRLWARRTVMGLIVAAAVLAIPLGSALLTRAIEQGAKKPVISKTLRTEFEQTVARNQAGRIVGAIATKTPEGWVVEISLSASQPPTWELAHEFAIQAARSLTGSTNTTQVKVRIETELVVESGGG